MLGERLRKLRKQHKLTMKELGRRLNLAESTISGYESGNRKPDMFIVEQLADFFDTSVDYLLGRHIRESNEPYVPEGKTIIPVYETIPPGQTLDQLQIESYDLMERSKLRGRKGFMLYAPDDSMSGDGIYRGDRVVVAAQNMTSPKEIAVITTDKQQATLCRIKRQGEICVLIPSNNNMEPQIYPSRFIFTLGKVIEVRRSLE